ncbi:MAG: DUF4097 domain-containing protein [Calditrichaeota bacterium]|nr:DUF4097 domain-containing protein [Calditrichota bacterium]
MLQRRNGPAIFSIFLSALLFTIFCFVGAAHCSSYESKISKSFFVKKNQTLKLNSDLGAVTVKSWARDVVKIDVIKKVRASSKRKAEDLFNRFKVDFVQNNQGIEVKGNYHGPHSWFFGGKKISVRYEIFVPYEFNLDIQTAGGSITVGDLAGKTRLNTSGGGISLGKILGYVDAKTSGGGITVEQVSGDVNVKTSGGGIRIGEVTGSLKAITSGGSISTKSVKGDAFVQTSGGSLKLYGLMGRVQGQTSGGSVTAEIVGEISGDSYLKTSGGGMKVYVNQDADFNIDAHSSGGGISADLPVTATGKVKSNTLIGKVNRGGSTLTLRTSGGSIRIKLLEEAK